MGLLSKLGGAVKEGLRNGAVNGLLKATGNSAANGKTQYLEYEYDANGNIKGVSSTYRTEIAERFGEATNKLFDGKRNGLSSSDNGNRRPYTKPEHTIEQYPSKYKNTTPKGLLKNDKSPSITNYSGQGNTAIKLDSYSDIYKLKLPDWSYADFINERAMWQKGLSSILDEPAWFYFKIFFDFDTNHGLFGGLLNSAYLNAATNSAAKYLYSIRKTHIPEKPLDRINSLYKFASILSYINTNAPWYFVSIKNLNKALVPKITEFSKENTIEIETMPDAVDMRLSTLMSLYSYACYDKYLDKEIIPQNLRKFNMSVILFQSPLRYLHTSYTTNQKMEFMGIDTSQLGNLFNKGKNQKVDYKNMSPNHRETGNFANTMSMKIITFYGCEFDINTLGNMVPSDITNETPFQLGKNSITISYTSAYEHTMNEFYGMMFGSDGFYFNQYSNFQLEDGTQGYVNKLSSAWETQKRRYETLQDTFDNLTQGGTILGIIDSPKKYKEAIDATEAVMNGIGESKNLLTSLGVNFALGLLGSSKNTDAPQGNLYGDYGIGSAYYKDKLEMLKNGVHERTTTPYYYDPYTGARIDLHKQKNYTAYNFKNDVSSIKNFNLSNWLNDKATDFGNKLNNGLRNIFGDKSDFVQNPYLSNNGQIANSNYKINEPGFVNAGEKGKTQVMVDNPNDWRNVEKPYEYNTNNNANSQFKSQDIVDENNTEHKVTKKPFVYDTQNVIEYESSKVVNQNKLEGATEKPFVYDVQNAVKYENSKAGGEYKIQDMVDKIGNAGHEVTKVPFVYNDKKAIEYEKSKNKNEST